MNLVLKAIKFADLKHEGQVRKGSGEKYVTHPVAVSYLVSAYKQSKRLDELIVAAILHDTLEDTDTTFVELATEFTPLVASLVLELTNDPHQIEILGKLEYQTRKMIGMSSYGLVIKLADRLHNISDQPTEKMVADTLKLMEALLLRRKLSDTHINLIDEILSICVKAAK